MEAVPHLLLVEELAFDMLDIARVKGKGVILTSLAPYKLAARK